MDSQPTRPFVRGAAIDPEDARRVRRWHLQWLAAIAAAGAVLTLALGDVPRRHLRRLRRDGVTGLLGLVLFRAGRSLMVLWAIAVAFAMSAAGGMTGAGAALGADPLLRRPGAAPAHARGRYPGRPRPGFRHRGRAVQGRIGPAHVMAQGLLTAASLATTAGRWPRPRRCGEGNRSRRSRQRPTP
jgi:hypothetical protein